MSKFVMRKEPIKPKRAIKRERLICIYDFSNLEQLLIEIGSANYCDCRIDYSWDHDSALYLVIPNPETEEEFAIRLKEYNIKKEKYDKWREANKENIEIYQEKNNLKLK